MVRGCSSRTRRARAGSTKTNARGANKNTKRTLLSEECPQRTRAKKRLTATRTSLRGSAKVARTKVVSWLRAVRLTFPAAPAASGVRVGVITARYSGGAAPAFNRFPWLPSAIDCSAKLSTSQRLRKRQNHRASDHQRKRYEIARIDRSRRRRGRKVDHRERIFGHVRREETSKVPVVDG